MYAKYVSGQNDKYNTNRCERPKNGCLAVCKRSIVCWTVHKSIFFGRAHFETMKERKESNRNTHTQTHTTSRRWERDTETGFDRIKNNYKLKIFVVFFLVGRKK